MIQVNPRRRTGKVQGRALGCADDSHVATCAYVLCFSMGVASMMIGLPREGLLALDGKAHSACLSRGPRPTPCLLCRHAFLFPKFSRCMHDRVKLEGCPAPSVVLDIHTRTYSYILVGLHARTNRYSYTHGLGPGADGPIPASFRLARRRCWRGPVGLVWQLRVYLPRGPYEYETCSYSYIGNGLFPSPSAAMGNWRIRVVARRRRASRSNAGTGSVSSERQAGQHPGPASSKPSSQPGITLPAPCKEWMGSVSRRITRRYPEAEDANRNTRLPSPSAAHGHPSHRGVLQPRPRATPRWTLTWACCGIRGS